MTPVSLPYSDSANTPDLPTVMQQPYNVAMLPRLRNVLLAMQEGSLNRAARRADISQPTLSRQIQSLEQELGGRLLERTPQGVEPTSLGFFVQERFAPLVKEFELALADTQAHAAGHHQRLRVGYLGLAAQKYLNPALKLLREDFADLQLYLYDQTPAEQLDALQEGRIDVALVGQELEEQARAFHCQRVASLGVRAVLPSEHPYASRSSVHLRELQGERFIGVTEESVPGRNHWIQSLCRRAGYRPKIVVDSNDVSETFTRVTGEGAIALLPDYFEGAPPPGVTFVKIEDKFARWDLLILRQRGKGLQSARRLVEIIAAMG